MKSKHINKWKYKYSITNIDNLTALVSCNLRIISVLNTILIKIIGFNFFK